MVKLLFFLPETLIKSLALFTKVLTKLLAKNLLISFVIILLLTGGAIYNFYNTDKGLKSELATTHNQDQENRDKLASVSAQLTALQNQDQVKRNNDLEATINKIHDTYGQAIKTYEKIQDLKAQTKQPYDNFDKSFADVLNKLSAKDYGAANTSLNTLNSDIGKEKDKVAAAQASVAAAAAAKAASANSAPATTTNNPSDSGYQRISVAAVGGNFTVDIVGADLGSTKVIVDTASDSDCGNNCPVMPLANYASRSGAYAAIAGPYFCPASYPSCAGKTNSFDTLLMNKNKHYFNSDNNVYSTIPAAIFSAGSARFVGKSLEWGRDTSPDSVIANYPLLVAGGNVVFGGSGDGKLTSRGPRGFIATKGSKVFIGYVLNATTSDQANVMKAMGMDQALNLDEGGSTALWVGGKYVEGPGRDLPFGVLFVKR
jgi:hypothetical protein